MKYKAIRVSSYISLLNLILLVQVAGLQWWMVLVPPIFMLLYWFESHYGIAGEQDAAWSRIKEWQEFKSLFGDVRKITFENAKDLRELKNGINAIRRAQNGELTGTEQHTQAKEVQEVLRSNGIPHTLGVFGCWCGEFHIEELRDNGQHHWRPERRDGMPEGRV